MSVSTTTSTTIVSNVKAGEENEISYKKIKETIFSLYISILVCVN